MIYFLIILASLALPILGMLSYWAGYTAGMHDDESEKRLDIPRS